MGSPVPSLPLYPSPIVTVAPCTLKGDQALGLASFLGPTPLSPDSYHEPVWASSMTI